ncbi:MAG: hypothetical protein K8T26_05085 [Lentisphaerae bacterium]|nr:hypothetical protein [Lentisphaerota bacterium]
MRLPRVSKETFRLAQDSAILVNAGMLMGLLFLLVHPILGRLMGPVDYAVFVQLMGLLTVLGVPASAVQVAVSRYVAEFAHGNQVSLWVTVVRRATRRLVWWTLASLLGWLALAGWIAGLLHVEAVTSLVILGVAGAINMFVPIVNGALQGAMLFRWLAFASLGSGVCRVLFCSGTSALVGGVDAALVAVGASLLAGLAMGVWPFRKILADTPALPGFDTRPVYRYLWPVLGGQTAVFVLINADVILSARLLAPADLALYGKVAMLSRTVLFVAQPIAYAMFPRAVNSSSLRVLLVPLAAGFAITLSGALGLCLMPGLPMRLMYGVLDPSYDALTRLYVWAALPLSMTMFMAQYLWARHQPGRVLVLLPILAVYLLALSRSHGSPAAMITAMAIAGTVAMLALIAGVLLGRRPPAACA